MDAFLYSDTTLPIRNDLVAVNRKTWDRIASAGCWWTGAERVAIATETRNARDCSFCRKRKSALSPNAVQGEHDSDHDVLAKAAVDTVHRIVTDQSRLSADWVKGLADQGITDAHYIELLGIIVAVISIDSFHFAMGLPPEPLPEPKPGEPSSYRPCGLNAGDAWVPMLTSSTIAEAERDLFPPLPQVPNVLRALSLVPDAVRSLTEQSGVYYLAPLDIADPTQSANRAISRQQMELVAARVSLLNECFY